MFIVAYVDNVVIQWATRHVVDDFCLRPAKSGVAENVFENSPCVRARDGAGGFIQP